MFISKDKDFYILKIMWNQLIFYHLCLYGFYYNLNKFRGDLKKTKSSLFGRNRTGPDILSLERSDIQTVPRKWEIKSVAEVARVRRHLSWWYIKSLLSPWWRVCSPRTAGGTSHIDTSHITHHQVLRLKNYVWDEFQLYIFFLWSIIFMSERSDD